MSDQSSRLSTNLAVVLHKPHDLRLEHRDIPQIGDSDVLVSVQKVGICGSDVHYWHRGSAGRFVVCAPLILGHESSGLVVKVGSKVTHLQPGDRVALEPGVPCRTCLLCKTGRYNLCAAVRFCATPPVDGTLCQYFAHPADFCFKLPSHVSYDLGALLEPLAVAVYSVKRCEVKAGDLVLVLGAGPIGLLCLLVAKAVGAARVAITDINEKRLDCAKRLGADGTMLLSGRDDVTEESCNIEKLLNGKPTAALECSGAESSIRLGLYALGQRGIMATVGRGPYDVTIPAADIVKKELDIRGIFRYANCYPDALDLISSGKLKLQDFVTHRFPMEKCEEAFQTALAGEAIKVMIDIN